ncbi:MAG: hypothetical protein CHACPFDD_03069 [Phycisphaerae bacterium]|nr:hypothetical protein [Phycisphaerae bacterium]
MKLRFCFRAAAAALLSSFALGQCGEWAADWCPTARVIPGTPGVYEILMDVSTATGVETHCGITVGHTVYFTITPTINGTLTFSTCHWNTTYDTVVEAYSGGDGQCEWMTSIQCVDDSPGADCGNGCSGASSLLTFPVSAGVKYTFCVGSYGNNQAGCTLCLGVVVTLCNNDTTPPVTQITYPDGLECVCDFVDVLGNVYDPDGTLRGYTLEYAPASGGGWTTIATGTSPVYNGLLGSWLTYGLPGGYYLLRLTAENICGEVSSTVVLPYVNNGFADLTVRSPRPGDILGGSVCVDGTAWDHCGPGWLMIEHRPLGGDYDPFDVIYAPFILYDPLGEWDSRAVVDGSYEIRTTAGDMCGYYDDDTRVVTIDNTAPVAYISDPLECATVFGLVTVRGTVIDTHLDSWTLYFAGGDYSYWVPISSGTWQVNNGVLGYWNTTELQRCAYALRLVVSDRAVLNCNGALHNQAEYVVTVSTIGVRGDMNCDESVNGFDVDPFVLALTDPEEYIEQYFFCDIDHGDVNEDGSINGFDVDPFVDILTGGG